MQTITTRTIDELNSLETDSIREWSGLTLKFRFSVGRTGSSYYGTTGNELHLLLVEDVIARSVPFRQGNVPVGGQLSIKGGCNMNGQNNGMEVEGKDAADITCKKCLKKLERINKYWNAKL